MGNFIHFDPSEFYQESENSNDIRVDGNLIVESTQPYYLNSGILTMESVPGIVIEQMMHTAHCIFESYADGPIFEKVDRKNKHEISRIARKIRDRLIKFDATDEGIVGTLDHKLRVTHYLQNFILETLKIFLNIWVIDPALISFFNNDRLKMYSWQTVCYIFGGSNTLKEAKDALNEKYQDILGDKYELDIIKLKFIFPTIRGKKELSEKEYDDTPNWFDNYLVIVNEKGTSVSNKTEKIKLTSEKEINLVKNFKLLEDVKPTGTAAQIKKKIKSALGIG